MGAGGLPAATGGSLRFVTVFFSGGVFEVHDYVGMDGPTLRHPVIRLCLGCRTRPCCSTSCNGGRHQNEAPLRPSVIPPTSLHVFFFLHVWLVGASEALGRFNGSASVPRARAWTLVACRQTKLHCLAAFHRTVSLSRTACTQEHCAPPCDSLSVRGSFMVARAARSSVVMVHSDQVKVAA